MKAKTHVFNGRLYAEGLKRLRVLGFGVLVLALVVSILVPAVHWMYQAGCQTYYYVEDVKPVDSVGYAVDQPYRITEFDIDEVCYTIHFLPFLTPIFFLVLFSYLFKRRESDFYHSIPYTRTCVYNSFVAAAFTWVAGITLLSALCAGVMWALDPFATFAVGDLVLLTAMSLSCTLMICGFMMLAITLCGNLTTVLLNFLLFALLPRAIFVMLGIVIESNMSIVDSSSIAGGLFCIEWWMPYKLVFMESGADPVKLTVYSAVVGLLLFVISGFCYKKRPSEMAGNSAPNPKAQHWLRCVFTLPFALILTTYLMVEYIELPVVLILTVAVLLVYYLYELITTKSFRNLLRATPWLCTVLAGCVIFVGIYAAIWASVVYPKAEAEDIRSIKLDYTIWELQKNDNSYENHRFLNLTYEDTEILEAVAEAWEYSQKHERGELPYDRSRTWIWMDMTLKSGRTITRAMLFDTDSYNAFLELIEYDEEAWNALYTLPAEELVTGAYIGGEYVDHLSDEELTEFLEIFRREYAAAPDFVKKESKSIGDNSAYSKSDYYAYLQLSGRDGEKAFYSRYAILPEFSESYAWIVSHSESNEAETEKQTSWIAPGE